MDLSRGRRRGDDVGSLSILMGSIVPGYELRKLIREQPAKLSLGSGVSETFEKSNVLTRLDQNRDEMRVSV